MRGPLRETYNPKSASLSASSSSSTQQQQQQQQQISKIPEKIKCVFKIKTKKNHFSFRQLLLNIRPRKTSPIYNQTGGSIRVYSNQHQPYNFK
jgi:hypothetical protein